VHRSGSEGPRSGDPPLAGRLWTVGHSTHPIEEFIAILRHQGITRIADVRRFPGSRKHPQFNPEALARALAEAGIAYTPIPELGGRRKPRADSPHMRWRNEAFRGYADYMDTAEFAAAAEYLADLARTDRVAIMCSEGVWWRCHRSMIADYFKARSWEVLHILGTGEPKEHPYTSVARVVDGMLTYA
jgi:uncharacterized protein (DUF488 family)